MRVWRLWKHLLNIHFEKNKTIGCFGAEEFDSRCNRVTSIRQPPTKGSPSVLPDSLVSSFVWCHQVSWLFWDAGLTGAADRVSPDNSSWSGSPYMHAH